MTKKKIIFAITKSFWGGAQRYVYDLATNLPKESFEIVVVAGGDGPLVEKLKTVEIKTVALPYLERDIAVWKDIKTFFFLLRFFRKEKPDIVHLNSSKIGGIGALAGELAGVEKIIFTCHGWAFNEDRPWLAKKAIKFATWISLLLQDKIIAVSAAVIKDISGLPFVSKKIFLIHNGIKEYLLLDRDEARNFFTEKLELKTALDSVWIGTISELTKNKGLEYAVEAIVKIKERPLVFIIIGEGELRENLKSQILNLKLENKVFLFGYLGDAKKYLPAFDIFTLTSVTEAFPYAVLEAGQAGLATLTSGVGGIKDVIIDNENGIFAKPKDGKNISESLIKLIENKKKREELGKNLKRTIVSEFTFEKMLEKTFNLY